MSELIVGTRIRIGDLIAGDRFAAIGYPDRYYTIIRHSGDITVILSPDRGEIELTSEFRAILHSLQEDYLVD